MKKISRWFKLFISPTRNQRGFSMVEITVALSLMLLMTLVVTPNYIKFQRDAENHLHLVNSISMMNAVQSGLLEGWVAKPATNCTTDVPLSSIVSQGYFLDIIDPSSATKVSYDTTDTIVQVFNNGGTLEFYIKLKSAENNQQIYVSTIGATNSRGSKQILKLEDSDVTSPY